MSNEEAIIDIRENIQPIVGGKSLDIAISALEKQIPKKPRLSRHYKCGMYYNDYYCPNDCDSYPQVFPSLKFCAHCGQALDWG